MKTHREVIIFASLYLLGRKGTTDSMVNSHLMHLFWLYLNTAHSNTVFGVVFGLTVKYYVLEFIVILFFHCCPGHCACNRTNYVTWRDRVLYRLITLVCYVECFLYINI